MAAHPISYILAKALHEFAIYSRDHITQKCADSDPKVQAKCERYFRHKIGKIFADYFAIPALARDKQLPKYHIAIEPNYERILPPMLDACMDTYILLSPEAHPGDQHALFGHKSFLSASLQLSDIIAGAKKQ